MPELPEVETVARCLQQQLVGDLVTAAHVLRPQTVASSDSDTFARSVVGRRFLAVRRRAKYLLLELEPQGFLLVHLRMSGRMRLVPGHEPCGVHIRLALDLASGRSLRLDDQRTFGRVWLVDDPASVLKGLGPEPLSDEWDADGFWRALERRHRMIKPLLLDQSLVAGLGNIYVDESLHRAGIHPARRSDSLRRDEAIRLHAAIREVLAEAIAHGGTTLRDYATPEGAGGAYQFALQVYGRENEPCGRCGAAIVKTRLAQRGTHYCPVCQPAPDSFTVAMAAEGADG